MARPGKRLIETILVIFIESPTKIKRASEAEAPYLGFKEIVPVEQTANLGTLKNVFQCLGRDGVKHRNVTHSKKVGIHVETANYFGIVDVSPVNQR